MTLLTFFLHNFFLRIGFHKIVYMLYQFDIQIYVTDNPNSLIDVEDVLDLRYPTTMTAPQHTPLSTMMAARWSISQSAGLEPAW